MNAEYQQLLAARPPVAEYVTTQSGWRLEYLTTDADKRVVLLVKREGEELSDGFTSYMDKRGKEPLFHVSPRTFSQVDPPYKIVSAMTGGDSVAAIQIVEREPRHRYRLQDYASGSELSLVLIERRARLDPTGHLLWEAISLLSAGSEAPCVAIPFSIQAWFTSKGGVMIGALTARIQLLQPQEQQPLALGLLLTAMHYMLFREGQLDDDSYQELSRIARGPREKA